MKLRTRLIISAIMLAAMILVLIWGEHAKQQVWTDFKNQAAALSTP